MVTAHRECNGEKNTFHFDSDAGGVLGGGVFRTIPDSAGIVEGTHHAIAVTNGSIHHAISAQRIDLILVPTAQVGAGAQNKTIEKWGLPCDCAGLERNLRLLAA